MDELEWVCAEEAARRVAKSYYLRTGIQLEPERFLDDIQSPIQKFVNELRDLRFCG